MYVMEYHAVLKQRKEKGLYVLIWNDLQNEINRTKKKCVQYAGMFSVKKKKEYHM